MTERRLRLATAALAVLGTAIAGYLTWIHYAGLDPICLAGGSCERVQASPYARLAGVPVALLGLAAYVAILAASALRGEAGRVAGAFLALAGVGFSGYLTYLEVAEIHAICQWCVASAAVMCALAVVTVWRASLA
jgi:uncharacterized membrane protein